MVQQADVRRSGLSDYEQRLDTLYFILITCNTIYVFSALRRFFLCDLPPCCKLNKLFRLSRLLAGLKDIRLCKINA